MQYYRLIIIHQYIDWHFIHSLLFQFPKEDLIECKVKLEFIVRLQHFRRCFILISLLTWTASFSIRSKLWIPRFSCSRVIPLIQKKGLCLKGKFPSTHQVTSFPNLFYPSQPGSPGIYVFSPTCTSLPCPLSVFLLYLLHHCVKPKLGLMWNFPLFTFRTLRWKQAVTSAITSWIFTAKCQKILNVFFLIQQKLPFQIKQYLYLQYVAWVHFKSCLNIQHDVTPYS